MTRDRSFRFRIANTMLKHADSVMPVDRRDWSRAMRNELAHIDQHQLLQWSTGCVIACYFQRLKAMNRSNFLVSRWVFAIEAAICLIPASMLWVFAMRNTVRFIDEPVILVSTLLMTIVPINLWLAMRFVAARRPLRYKMHITSALLLAIYAALQLAGMHFTGHGASFMWFQADWGSVFMLAILPAFCCWHLSLFAIDKPATPLAAQ